jgi:hypothetical protein
MSAGDCKPEKITEKHGEGVNHGCGRDEKHWKRNHKCGQGEKYGGDRSKNVAAVINTEDMRAKLWSMKKTGKGEHKSARTEKRRKKKHKCGHQTV